MNLHTFKVDIKNYIAEVIFNLPQKANALDAKAWVEMQSVFEKLSDDPKVRVIILSGEGKHFCAGIDLKTLMEVQANTPNCEAKKRAHIRKFIFQLQASITAIEKCQKPVIAAIHGGCIGGAVDIVTACDMRFCTEDAYFTIKETDLGLVADLGTLQRLPTIIHPGMVAEMAYTARKVFGPEAKEINLVNRAFESKEIMMKTLTGLAQQIAEKSPLVISGIKEMLLYKRDHSVSDSLHNMANYNAAMLLSDDLGEAVMSGMQKRKANFEDY